MERTLIKFVCSWRKISRKSRCRGDSERLFPIPLLHNIISALLFMHDRIFSRSFMDLQHTDTNLVNENF